MRHLIMVYMICHACAQSDIAIEMKSFRILLKQRKWIIFRTSPQPYSSNEYPQPMQFCYGTKRDFFLLSDWPELLNITDIFQLQIRRRSVCYTSAHGCKTERFWNSAKRISYRYSLQHCLDRAVLTSIHNLCFCYGTKTCIIQLLFQTK